MRSYAVNGEQSLFYPVPIKYLFPIRVTLHRLVIIGTTAVPCIILAQLSRNINMQGMTKAYAIGFVFCTGLTAIQGSASLWIGGGTRLLLTTIDFLVAQIIILFSTTLLVAIYLMGAVTFLPRMGLSGELDLWKNLAYIALGIVLLAAIAIACASTFAGMIKQDVYLGDEFRGSARKSDDVSNLQRFLSNLSQGFPHLLAMVVATYTLSSFFESGGMHINRTYSDLMKLAGVGLIFAYGISFTEVGRSVPSITRNLLERCKPSNWAAAKQTARTPAAASASEPQDEESYRTLTRLISIVAAPTAVGLFVLNVLIYQYASQFEVSVVSGLTLAAGFLGWEAVRRDITPLSKWVRPPLDLVEGPMALFVLIGALLMNRNVLVVGSGIAAFLGSFGPIERIVAAWFESILKDKSPKK